MRIFNQHKVLVFLTILFSLSFSNTFSQTADRISRLEDRLRKIDSLSFHSAKEKIETALYGYGSLIVYYQLLERNSSLSLLYTDLITATNPNNDSLILGESYTSIIKKEAESILKINLAENAKNGFQQVLDKITTIPVLGNLINTNPVASLATNIITSASNFLGQKITGGIFGQKVIKYTEGVKKEKIKEFNNKIEPFVLYYDKILDASRSFSPSIELFQANFQDKHNVLRNDFDSLRRVLKLSIPLRSDEISALFTINNRDYEEALEREAIVQALPLAMKYIEHVNALKIYNEEFSKIFGLFTGRYSEALDNLKDYASKNGHPIENIDKLQKRISQTMFPYISPKTGGIASAVDPTKPDFNKVNFLHSIREL